MTNKPVRFQGSLHEALEAHEISRPTMFLMVGLPASGKTTWVRKRLPDAIRVSHDDLYRATTGRYRKELRRFYHYVENAMITQALFVMRQDVVIDRTLTRKKDRARFIELGDTPKVCLYITTPVEECLKRNVQRQHQVPPEVITRMNNKFQMPQEEEGFDLIIHIKYEKT